MTTTIRASPSCSACSSGLANLIPSSRPAQGVDPGVAGDEDLADGDVLPDQVLQVGRGRDKVHRGDLRDHLAVQLLREWGQVAAAGAQAGLDVHHRDPQVEGGKGRRHRRAGVAVDEDRGRAAAAEHVVGRCLLVEVDLELLNAEVFEALHHRGDPLVQVGAAGARPEGDVGLDLGQLEDVLDQTVVLTGRDDDRFVAVAVAQGADDRDQLDRLRPGTDDDRHDQLVLGQGFGRRFVHAFDTYRCLSGST